MIIYMYVIVVQQFGPCLHLPATKFCGLHKCVQYQTFYPGSTAALWALLFHFFVLVYKLRLVLYKGVYILKNFKGRRHKLCDREADGQTGRHAMD